LANKIISPHSSIEELTIQVSHLQFLSVAKITQLNEWVWSNGGMVLTRENKRTQRKPCPNATLPTTNPIRTGLALNLGHCTKKQVTNCRTHSTALVKINTSAYA